MIAALTEVEMTEEMLADLTSEIMPETETLIIEALTARVVARV